MSTTFGYTPSGAGETYPATHPCAIGDDPYTMDIKAHYQLVMMEDPESVTAAATAWSGISTALDAQRESLTTRATTLQGQWESDAAEAFLLRVGESTWSLDDWSAAAKETSTALETLATQITSAKTTMEEVWSAYAQEAR